jgi:hypothetical protein
LPETIEEDVAAGLTDGERWARSELQALLDARFSAPGLARFLARSQRRARAVRRERPALTRQARRWTAVGAGCWLWLAALDREPFRRRVGTGLGWWAACGVMLDWHLGMVEDEDGRPVALGIADACTLARAWLVPVAADAAHPVVVALGAASDALDGPLARATRTTRAGRDLEGLVDVCFALAALRGARRVDGLSGPAAGAELGRLAAGVAYALASYFGRAAAPSPSFLRAGRALGPLRAAGLIAAGAGHRRTAGRLVAGSAALSVALLLRAMGPTAARPPAPGR